MEETLMIIPTILGIGIVLLAGFIVVILIKGNKIKFKK